MYPRYIEVHDGADPMTVNCDNIEWFADETISMVNCEIRVIESYDELKALIQDAGYAINKADPRLDSKPLTMDDMKNMVGQPVWSSYSSKWYLVTEVYKDGEGFEVIENKGDIVVYGKNALLDYPLYGMKVADE